MRNFKFRAWDKDIKAFVPLMDWIEEFKKSKLRYLGNEVVVKNSNVASLHTVLTHKDIELTQYTGIKDKNGKDVYEGDIFRCCEGNLYEVIFCESYLRYEATEIYMKESFELNDFICAGNNYDDILDGHIIGNKFENKELYNIE